MVSLTEWKSNQHRPVLLVTAEVAARSRMVSGAFGGGVFESTAESGR